MEAQNGLPIIPAHPRRADTRSFPKQGRRRRKTGSVYFTHPTMSRPRPALSHGYIEDFAKPRTQLGKERVPARLGKGGCNGGLFSILIFPCGRSIYSAQSPHESSRQQREIRTRRRRN